MGSDPAASRPFRSLALGKGLELAGLAMDVGEMILIFTPAPGDEDVTALYDLGVTYAAGVFSGKNYLPWDRPYSGLPPMVSVNQDFLVTAGDLALGSGSKLAGTAMTGLPGWVTAIGIDVVTTGVSIAYDAGAYFDQIQNRVSIGVCLSLDETFGDTVIIFWP
jgi:hypothetical protein